MVHDAGAAAHAGRSWEVRPTPATRESLTHLIQASRTLGDPRLTLHGGGNTSIKGIWLDVTGAEVPVLFVKGSGHALATIDESGFAPLRLERVRQLLPPTHLGDLELADELRCAVLDSSAPDPSVESLVHALLPHLAVLHSHSDAVLALTNTPDGATLVERLYGDRVLIVDYAMPGPELGAACAEAWAGAADRQDRLDAIVVLKHGLFTMADSVEEALRRHLEIVATADAHLAAARRSRKPRSPLKLRAPDARSAVEIAGIRARLSEVAGVPLILRRDTSEATARLLADPEVLAASVRGPLTPDHVIWTGPRPLVDGDIGGYATAYAEYFEKNRHRRGQQLVSRDPAPRVVLDTGLGLLSAGRTGRESRVVEDIVQHTLAGIADAEALGGYEPAEADHVFDLEYWAPQQQKLLRADPRLPLAGRVVVVTGAASGIGRACAAEFLASGASVIGWDRSPGVATTFGGPEWLGLEVDVSDSDAQRRALALGVDTFGGLDILVVAAGIFPAAQHLDELDPAQWRRAMSINVDSVAELFGMAHPMLKLAPGGGRVCVIASKNVAAPGPGAAAYSASKAAITQLARVAALEWAPDGIRVNLVHPDAVFDTALWTPELLATRAEHYGITVDEYKRRNLLGVEVRSADVATMVRAMADETFRCTTGAQVPVDGGNDRVI